MSFLVACWWSHLKFGFCFMLIFSSIVKKKKWKKSFQSSQIFNCDTHAGWQLTTIRSHLLLDLVFFFFFVLIFIPPKAIHLKSLCLWPCQILKILSFISSLLPHTTRIIPTSKLVWKTRCDAAVASSGGNINLVVV